MGDQRTGALNFFGRIRAVLENDAALLIIIFIFSASLRLPHIAFPERAQFDEILYTNFIVRELDQIPYFEIHPPFTRMLFSAIADNTPSLSRTFPIQVGTPYGDFPYLILRVFIALLGSLLPVTLFLIARTLNYSPGMALLTAFFAAIDSALILYSRAILPDTPLVLMNFLALLFALLASTRPKGLLGALAAILSGVFIGFALATKWTSGAILALIFIIFSFKKTWRWIPVVLSLVLIIYAGSFYAFVTKFKGGGAVDPVFPVLSNALDSFAFPENPGMDDTAELFTAYSERIERVNKDTGTKILYMDAPSPVMWPIALANIDFYNHYDGSLRITLSGNSILWFSVFLLLLFELSWIAWNLLKRRVLGVDRTELFLLAGYFMNYLPFFLIDRPMYLYHYFTALCFLFLLAPRVAPRFLHCIGAMTKDRLFAKFLGIFVLMLIVVNFLLLIPVTYGIPVGPYKFLY